MNLCTYIRKENRWNLSKPCQPIIYFLVSRIVIYDHFIITMCIFYTLWQSLKSLITMSLDKLLNLIHLNNVISNVLVVLFIGNTNLDDKRIKKAINYKSITIRLLLSCSTGAWPIRRGFDRICIQWGFFFKSNLINQIKKYLYCFLFT